MVKRRDGDPKSISNNLAGGLDQVRITPRDEGPVESLQSADSSPTQVAIYASVDLDRTGVFDAPHLDAPHEDPLLCFLQWPSKRDRASTVRVRFLERTVRGHLDVGGHPISKFPHSGT